MAATRFYIPNTASAVSPAFDTAFWEQTTGAIRRALVTSPSNTALASNNQTDSTATADRDVLLYQLVSDGIAPGPIAGTFKGQMQAVEFNANQNLRAQVQVWLVSNDGSTTRGVLYAGDLETLTGNPTNEWGISFNSYAFPRAGSVSVSPLSAQNTDRIVIEVGYRKHAALSTQATIRIGDATASADLAEGNATGETGTSFRPWFEFSEDLFTSRLRGARAYILG